MVDGRRLELPGWMYVLAMASEDQDWAVKEVRENIDTYRLRVENYGVRARVVLAKIARRPI